MFAQRVIHSLQVSRNLSTAAAALKSSRTSIIWTRPNEIDSYHSHLSSGTYSSENAGKRVIRKVVIFMVKMEMRTAVNLTIKEGFQKFLRWCKLNNYAPDTVRFYERSIYNFSLFHSLDSPISDLDEDLIEEYTLYLLRKSTQRKN